MQPNLRIMESLIELARDNHRKGEHAVAAAVVQNETVIATGVTTLNQGLDPTAHAEVNAIRSAAKILKSRFLLECYLYSTFEPCPMCASAAVWAKMRGIVYGAGHEDRTEKYPFRVLIPARQIIEHGTPVLELHQHIMREECVELLKL